MYVVQRPVVWVQWVPSRSMAVAATRVPSVSGCVSCAWASSLPYGRHAIFPAGCLAYRWESVPFRLGFRGFVAGGGSFILLRVEARGPLSRLDSPTEPPMHAPVPRVWAPFILLRAENPSVSSCAGLFVNPPVYFPLSGVVIPGGRGRIEGSAVFVPRANLPMIFRSSSCVGRRVRTVRVIVRPFEGVGRPVSHVQKGGAVAGGAFHRACFPAR